MPLVQEGHARLQRVSLLHGPEDEDHGRRLPSWEVVMYSSGPSIGHAQTLEMRATINECAALALKVNRDHYVINLEDGRIICRIGPNGLEGWLTLGYRDGWQSEEVYHVYIEPKARGYGFGARLYDTAINDMGILLMTGNQQSPDSRRLWRRFVATNRYNTWAVDLRHPSIAHEVIATDDGLECHLDLYSDTTSRVRLCAQRK